MLLSTNFCFADCDFNNIIDRYFFIEFLKCNRDYDTELVGTEICMSILSGFPVHFTVTQLIN